MGYAAVLVFMATSLSYILFQFAFQSVPVTQGYNKLPILTDFAMGLFGMDTVVKLNGSRVSLSLAPLLVWVYVSVWLELNDGFTGLRRLGSVGTIGLRGVEKGSINGDKELRLDDAVEVASREGSGVLGDSSGGGVGERGGTGMGRPEAIVASEAAETPSLAT